MHSNLKVRIRETTVHLNTSGHFDLDYQHQWGIWKELSADASADGAVERATRRVALEWEAIRYVRSRWDSSVCDENELEELLAIIESFLEGHYSLPIAQRAYFVTYSDLLPVIESLDPVGTILEATFRVLGMTIHATQNPQTLVPETLAAHFTSNGSELDFYDSTPSTLCSSVCANGNVTSSSSDDILRLEFWSAWLDIIPQILDIY